MVRALYAALQLNNNNKEGPGRAMRCAAHQVVAKVSIVSLLLLLLEIVLD